MSDTDFDAFIASLAAVIGENALPEEVERNLKGKIKYSVFVLLA